MVNVVDFDDLTIADHIREHCIETVRLDEKLTVMYGKNPLFLNVMIGNGVSFHVDFSELSSLSTDSEIIEIVLRAVLNEGITIGSNNIRSQLRSVIGI